MEGRDLTRARIEPGLGDVLQAGTRLGEYEIERVLGSGGMGTVYAAWHPVLRSRAAIKVLNQDVSHSAAMVERFVSEAQAASRITHPNIIKVFGFGELADGRKYFVMEFLEGETVTAWLAKGRPDPGEALELLLQVCEALEAAHREGIVHRDLKPDNLWIARPRHGRPYIKVLDFGIAKALEGPVGKTNTQTGSIMGTPQFMSPEQCTGRGVDHRTDIYAMGGILYWVYCGRPPFERESPAELVAAHLYDTVPMPSVFAAVPAALEQLILACLAKDPSKRPQRAVELADRLRKAAAPEALGEAARPALPPTAKLVVPTVVELDPSTAVPEPRRDDVPGSDDELLGRSRHRWWLLGAGSVVAAGLIVWLVSRVPHGPDVPSSPAVIVPSGASGTRPAAALSGGKAAALLASPAVPATDDRAAPAAARAAPAVASPRPRKAKRVTFEAAPASEPTPLQRRPKPSRTAREGLIEENPFR